MKLLSFIKRSLSSDYCLILSYDSQFESSESVNSIEKFRPGSWFRIRCLELSPIYLDTNFLPHLKKKRKSIENCFVVLLWHHFIILWQKVTPKCVQSDVKVTPKWCQSDAKVMPKWRQSDAKVTPKWVQSDAKVTPKWHQNVKESTHQMALWIF